MVIGVDAGALSVKDDRLKVGVYRVISNLLAQIAQLDNKNEYRLYSFQELDPSAKEWMSDRMYSMVIPPKAGWFRLRLPFSLFVHPIDLFLGVSQALPVGLQKNIGFIYDLGFIHHPEVYPHSFKRLKSQTDRVATHSKHIITISESSKKDICDHYKIDQNKVTVAYPGVSDNFNQTGQTFVGNAPYFIHVGSLKPGKNIPTLIKAFSQFLSKTQRDFLLLIVGGDYWMDEEIQTAIKENNVEENVRLLGFLPDHLLPQYYRGATAFVTTSISEGFCLPVLEAMASGIPVIASNIDAFPEVAAEERLLFPPQNHEDFAQAMDSIVNDTQLRDVAIAKGLAKAQRYSWKGFAVKVLEVIQSVQ